MEVVEVPDQRGRAPGRLDCGHCGARVGQIVAGRLYVELDLPSDPATPLQRRTYTLVVDGRAGAITCPDCRHTNDLGGVLGRADHLRTAAVVVA